VVESESEVDSERDRQGWVWCVCAMYEYRSVVLEAGSRSLRDDNTYPVTRELVKHPVLGGIEPLEVLLGSTSLREGSGSDHIHHSKWRARHDTNRWYRVAIKAPRRVRISIEHCAQSMRYHCALSHG